jgi:ATP-dependent DNA helicase RecQ
MIAAAHTVLREVFGHAALRGGQAEAIEAVLAGRDAVVVLPTGAGKSLCYQVPAVALARAGRGTALVISPLIALMVDQVEGLTGRGVAAAALHSHQDDAEQRQVMAAFARGELAMLYVSPERAASAGFRRLVARARIALVAIDEAHCVSQWGHDFRPEYMQLHELRELPGLGDVPAIALTATATPRVTSELVTALALRAPEIVRGDFRRPNLSFAVEHHRGDETRLAATCDALAAAGLRARSGAGRGIVYCATRKKTQDVVDALKAAGFAAGHYHAGRTALARDRAQRGFALGKTRVLVATSAFGMGVDYPDVRVIVHFQAPGSLEAYYQEAGRAGRDGEAGRCLMLFGAADLVVQRKLQQGSGGRGQAEALAALERYAHARTCRQQILCAHFTGSDDHAACGQCDACLGPTAAPSEPAPVVAALGSAEQQVIADAVAAVSRRVGRINLALALRGSKAKAVVAHGLVHIPQYGALGAQSEAAIVATIDQMIRERRLVRRGKKYPTVALPGPAPSRSARPRGAGPRITSLALALDTYRKRKARQLGWKVYMVFPRSVIAALDQQRPASAAALERIPGLGPAKIARFGSELLALVREHLRRT